MYLENILVMSLATPCPAIPQARDTLHSEMQELIEAGDSEASKNPGNSLVQREGELCTTAAADVVIEKAGLDPSQSPRRRAGDKFAEAAEKAWQLACSLTSDPTQRDKMVDFALDASCFLEYSHELEYRAYKEPNLYKKRLPRAIDMLTALHTRLEELGLEKETKITERIEALEAYLAAMSKPPEPSPAPRRWMVPTLATSYSLAAVTGGIGAGLLISIRKGGAFQASIRESARNDPDLDLFTDDICRSTVDLPSDTALLCNAHQTRLQTGISLAVVAGVLTVTGTVVAILRARELREGGPRQGRLSFSAGSFGVHF